MWHICNIYHVLMIWLCQFQNASNFPNHKFWFIYWFFLNWSNVLLIGSTFGFSLQKVSRVVRTKALDLYCTLNQDVHFLTDSFHSNWNNWSRFISKTSFPSSICQHDRRNDRLSHSQKIKVLCNKKASCYMGICAVWVDCTLFRILKLKIK